MANISSLEVDRLAGITKGHTSAIELGNRSNATAKILGAIASTLGISLDWLVNGLGKKADKKIVIDAIERSRDRYRKRTGTEG